jgi:hypothetical protein
MTIPRFYNNLGDFMLPGKVLAIYGPRQVGKTTLLKSYLKTIKDPYLLDFGDNLETQRIFESHELRLLQEYTEGYSLLAIDEAQMIRNVGASLKILIDQIPSVRIIVTGSSSFDLAGQIGEPLVGRKTTLSLFPIAQLELKQLYNRHELKQHLQDYLVFGSYPEVFHYEQKAKKADYLNDIISSCLLKDIFDLENVKYTHRLLDLLRLLAYQIGSEVSLSELGSQLQIDGKTVARYLDLLEKSFIIFNLRGFSRNLRKEISKKSKYYFYDNGIRNALVQNFNDISVRNDLGILWENFLFMERMKKRKYQGIHANIYFWRTWEGEEIDLVEERDGKLFGYEFKYTSQKIKKAKTWFETYPEAELQLITQDNYLDFIL